MLRSKSNRCLSIVSHLHNITSVLFNAFSTFRQLLTNQSDNSQNPVNSQIPIFDEGYDSPERRTAIRKICLEESPLCAQLINLVIEYEKTPKVQVVTLKTSGDRLHELEERKFELMLEQRFMQQRLHYPHSNLDFSDRHIFAEQSYLQHQLDSLDDQIDYESRNRKFD